MMITTLLDMIMGMMLGMVASPLMMKGIKVIRQRRKVNRILREISDERRNYVSEVKSRNTQEES
jgi:ribosomal protein S17